MQRRALDGPGHVPLTRRKLMGATVSAVSTTTIATLLTPAEARAQGTPFQLLSPAEAMTMEAVAETLVIGSAAQGAAHFVDQQCSGPPQQALLALRIAGVESPFIGFYRTVLAEIDRQSQVMFSGARFASRPASDQHIFIDRMRRGELPEWRGPPQGLGYAVLRQDALDVGYGTMTGSQRLDVPYMAHIAPVQAW